MMVRVTTVSVETGVQYGQSKIINYANPASRQWLAKHSFWAFNNGYGVATNNIADEPKQEEA